MDTATLSEPSYLITELRYTLGQLHVQLGDLDAEMSSAAACEGRSIDQVMQDMTSDEREYQARYRDYTRGSGGNPHGEDALVGQTEFERLRNRTVTLLESLQDPWPVELTEIVRQQIAHDRQRTDSIAACRKALYDQDLRPDLNESLVTEEDNKPHALS